MGRATLVGLGILTVFLAGCSGGSGSISTGMPAASVSPTSLTFSNQTVNTTSAGQPVTLSNTGSLSLAIANIAASGNFAETNNCGSNVAAGANCTIMVTFTPTVVGTNTGMITITDNAPSSGSQQTVSLTGTGVAATGQPVASLSTTKLAFGNQAVSSTGLIQTVTVTNTGGQALNVSGVAASANFTQTNNCNAGLGTGASCTISIAFAPTASGPLTGTITIADNTSGSPQTVSLTGVATDGLGRVTGASIGCGSGVAGTCYHLNISSCPSVADMDGVTLRVRGPSGSPKGTIILGTGLGGVGFYEDVFAFGKNMITSLVNAGFTTVQMSFTGTIHGVAAADGWLTGPGGPRKLACRYASAAQWVYQNIHNANAAAPYCATGNSGGSAAIAYSLAHYGLDSIFAMVEPTSGPPMGRVDRGCICNQPPVSTAATGCPNPPAVSECYAGSSTLLDAAYGSSICSQGDTTNATLFLNDSVASPDANLSYPKTAVRFVYGGQDTSAAVPLGLEWAAIILTNHAIACAPTAPHAIADDMTGANMIASDLINSCKLQ